MPFVLRDTTNVINGREVRYGIPTLLCSYWLIYRDGDEEIAKAESINDVYHILGDTGVGKNKGLLCNFSTDYPYYYFEAVHDDADPNKRHIDTNDTTINENALTTVKQMQAMSRLNFIRNSSLYFWLFGSFKNYEDFCDNLGRAMYGYSEAMYSVQPIIDDVNVKLISMGTGENLATFYTDLTSINANIKDEKKVENCKKLINLLASKEYLYKIAYNRGTPVYLLPVTEDSYKKLEKVYPMYSELKKEMDKADKHIIMYEDSFYDYNILMTEKLAKIIEK